MANDNVVLVDASGGARNITLPTPTSGRVLQVKDKLGNAATNNITILPNASETIDGASSKVISAAYGSVQLVSDGTNWFTESSPAGTGVTTVGSFGSSPTANGATISGSTITLQPADGTNPGAITAGTQTIGGAKTFSTSTSTPNATATTQFLGPTSATVPAHSFTGSTGYGFGMSGTSLLFTHAGTSNYAITSSQFQGVAGTSSNPGYSSAGDTNTGMNLAGSDVLNLVTGATIAIAIDASQIVTIQTNDLKINTAGKTLFIKEGSNAKMGTATLSAGTVTVNTTAVTANSRIFLTIQSLGTVTVPKAIAVTALTANNAFTITSADATDTSVVAWVILEPA